MLCHKTVLVDVHQGTLPIGDSAATVSALHPHQYPRLYLSPQHVGQSFGMIVRMCVHEDTVVLLEGSFVTARSLLNDLQYNFV
jgi:hypothetical protein